MIYRKGEFVELKNCDKKFSGCVGRIHKVGSLESELPFMVELFSGSERFLFPFAHNELEILDHANDASKKQYFNIQVKMYQLQLQNSMDENKRTKD